MKPQVIKILLICSGVITLICLYYFVNPAHCVWVPKCPFYMLTGYKCPGCGTQRALHAFLRGDIINGFKHNPILVPSLGYIILLLQTRHTPMHDKLSNKIACNTIVVVFCAYWILRNVFNF